MKSDTIKIEQRLQNMKNVYYKMEKIIDKLPDGVPEDVRNMLKNKILGDKELKKLMDGIDAHRPPRLFLIGRTGVGKSSLINALCGSYVARVSDTRSCTDTANMYQCMDGDRVLMEICDTRGLAESESLDNLISAEDMLIKQINEFSPDVAIFMLNCTRRDDVNKDVNFLKNLSKAYSEVNKMRLPIVVVVNKSDEMQPNRFKEPSEYPQYKLTIIEEQVQFFKKIIVENGLEIDDIIAVSSLINWMTPDGVEIGVKEIDNLPEADIENLQIAFDGRYNIEELRDILEEAIRDFEAQMGLRMAARLTDVVHRLAKRLNDIFSTIAGIVATNPIPIADIYVLLILQAVLVSLIASLSGRDISLDTAKEFILSMAGIVGAGYTFRLAAQQASKLVNVFWPGAGSAISGAIAILGTTAIGETAISYYIDGEAIETVKKKFDTSKEG